MQFFSLAIAVAVFGIVSASADERKSYGVVLDAHSKGLKALEELSGAKTCPSCVAQSGKKEQANTTCANEAGASVSPAEVEQAKEKARLAWLDNEMMLDEKSDKELRQILWGEADKLERYSLMEGSNQELLHEWAKGVRDLAQSKKVRERLHETSGILSAEALSVDSGDGEAKGWRWRKAGKKEVIGIGVSAAIGGLAEGIFYSSHNVRASGGILFDDQTREQMRLETESERLRISKAGDLAVAALVLYPALDSAIALGAVRGDKESALQTTLINLESFAFTAALYGSAKALVARSRPNAAGTQDGKCEDSWDCGSFPSGHTAFAFTAAGLVCTHHSYLSIYGGKTSDYAACVGAMALAAFTGATRIMSDNHYASDVAMGAAIGLISGMALPRLLHYRFDDKKKTSSAIVAPMVLEGGGGLFCSIEF